MNELKSQLLELNEAIETIKITLDSFGDDPELVEQLKKLVTDREALIAQIQSIN